MRTAACLIYSESPAHHDEYFATKAKQFASCGASAILLYDACGVLRPERIAPLVEAIRIAAPGLPVELNVHDQTGLALACYREALSIGVGALSTAARPVAGANSVPATADVIALARELSVDVDVDEDEVAWLDSYFRFVAHVYGKPQRHDVCYDEQAFRQYVGHQIPGGMMSHFVGQLESLGIADRLPEVLEEAARVRVELGCPGMVTPFSQMVGVQAMLNVLDGRRYHTVPADLRSYAAGYYGEPPGAIDPGVLDRLLGDEPRVDPTAAFAVETMPAIRAGLPAGASDDGVFLALFSSPDKIAAMRRQPRDTLPAKELTPLTALLGQLAARTDLSRVDICYDASRT